MLNTIFPWSGHGASWWLGTSAGLFYFNVTHFTYTDQGSRLVYNYNKKNLDYFLLVIDNLL
ncbi:MAG: hypothetical protein HFJ38_03995 [Bacilli bacterium]|nr:hypothetical protein [Bacilli bacterium]